MTRKGGKNVCTDLLQSSPCRDLRTEAEQTDKILSNVLRLNGVRPHSSAYVWYCVAMDSGIMRRTTFGTVITSFDKSFMLFSPNGWS